MTPPKKMTPPIMNMTPPKNVTLPKKAFQTILYIILYYIFILFNINHKSI